MDILDRQLQKGSAFMVLLGATLTILFAVYFLVEPEHRHFSLLLTLSGVMGIWRQYIIWTRKRRQNGLELIGTDPQDERDLSTLV